MADAFNEQLTGQVVMALRRIIRVVEQHSRSLVSRYGLTGPQVTVLKELSGRGDLSIGELARGVSLSQATMTGIVVRLEKAGLVRRGRGAQDRRRVFVSLTEHGRDVADRTPPLLQDRFAGAFAGLQAWEQTQILSSVQRLVVMLEAKDIDATPMLATGPLDASPEQTEAFFSEKGTSQHEFEVNDASMEATP